MHMNLMGKSLCKHWKKLPVPGPDYLWTHPIKTTSIREANFGRGAGPSLLCLIPHSAFEGP